MTWSIPYTFASQSGNVPVSEIDSNFIYVSTAIQANASTYAVDTGTTNAYAITLTPSPTLADGVGLKFRAASTNTTQPTLAVNGGTAYNIYLSNGGACPANAIPSGAIVDVIFNSTFNSGSGGFELAYLPSASGATASGLPSAVRQAVLTGPSSSGLPASVTTGTGLAPGLSASGTSPVVISYANGFGTSGQIDIYTTTSANTSFPSVPANNTSFLYGVYASPTLVSLGNTLAIPQYGAVYNQAAQASLTFNQSSAVFTDDFGNTWTNTSVTASNSSPAIAGTYYGVFNGTTSNMKSTAFTSFGPNGWSCRAWGKTSSIAAIQTIFSAPGATSNFGSFLIQVNTSGKTVAYISSTGTSWDQANGTTGSATLSTGTWYFIELTYDPVAGKYYIYVNGTIDQTITASAVVSSPNSIYVGAWYTGSVLNTPWVGNIQGFEYLPYCQHPAATTYSSPTALANLATAGYASDWFDTRNYIMYQVSGASSTAGTNPTFTQVNRVYIGECISGGSSISSVVSYAYNGMYDSGLYSIASNTSYTKSHNLGTYLSEMTFHVADDSMGKNERPCASYLYYSPGSTSYGWYAGAATRNSAVATTQTSGWIAVGGGAQSSGYGRTRVKRSF